MQSFSLHMVTRWYSPKKQIHSSDKFCSISYNSLPLAYRPAPSKLISLRNEVGWSLRSLKLSWRSRCTGLISPDAIASNSYSLLSLRAILTSGTRCSTICFSNGAMSKRAVSSGSSNHDFIVMPLSGYSKKFSVMLSTMMVRSSSLPK